MKTIFKIITLLLLGFYLQGNSQILGKLKEKANKALNSVENTTKSVKKTTDMVTGSGNSGGGLGSLSTGAAGSDYFTDNSIKFSKTRNGNAEKNFTITDNIYATVTMKQPLIEYLKEEGIENEPFKMIPVSLIYIINGAAYGEYTSAKVMKADYDKKTLVLDILPAKGDAKTQYLTAGQYKAAIARPLSAFDQSGITEATYGTQRFDFTFGINDEYHGSFNFTVKNKAEQKIASQRAEEGQMAMSDAIATETKLPAEFSKMGKFSDPDLSLAKIKNMISYDGMTILKLVIDASGGNDYNINKNDLGVPTIKVTNKPVWLAFKADGKCFFTKKYFTRDYEGGGKYGPLELATSTADVTPIACENIK